MLLMLSAVCATQGTIRTEEEWEEHYWESHFCICINDGASGVVVDGEVGATSILRYLNHSCEPNAQMKYALFRCRAVASVDDRLCVCVNTR